MSRISEWLMVVHFSLTRHNKYSSTVASDRNLKTNIIDTKYGLGDVLKLQGREFDWKREDRGHDVGFIAQEVQEVIPELVKEVDSIGENDGDKHFL